MPPSLQIDAWFRLLDLYNFDVVERTVTANVLHHLSWTDQRISMHGNCPAQILSADIFDKVWVPDLDVDHFRSFSIKSIVKEQKFLKVSRQKSRVIVDYSFSATSWTPPSYSSRPTPSTTSPNPMAFRSLLE